MSLSLRAQRSNLPPGYAPSWGLPRRFAPRNDNENGSESADRPAFLRSPDCHGGPTRHRRLSYPRCAARTPAMRAVPARAPGIPNIQLYFKNLSRTSSGLASPFLTNSSYSRPENECTGRGGPGRRFSGGGDEKASQPLAQDNADPTHPRQDRHYPTVGAGPVHSRAGPLPASRPRAHAPQGSPMRLNQPQNPPALRPASEVASQRDGRDHAKPDAAHCRRHSRRHDRHPHRCHRMRRLRCTIRAAAMDALPPRIVTDDRGSTQGLDSSKTLI